MEEKPVKNKNQLKNQERREFIKKTTLAGAAVATTTLASTAAIAEASGDVPAKPGQKGYELTPHVISYYKSAGI